MNEAIIEKFIEKITDGKSEYTDLFYEIFSARGFLLEIDRSAGKIWLSGESHRDDCEFLEILQDSNYKKVYKKPHQDSIEESDNEHIAQNCHPYFDSINTHLFDIKNTHYLEELFTHEIPIDIFRLNWERDWYGKFNQFKEIHHLPKIRVYDLEPFIARLTKAVSSIGISTWSSCEGHWGKPAFIVFDRKYHRVWFQTVLNRFIKKKADLTCKWTWFDNRCIISNPEKDILKMYLEIQKVARLIYHHRAFLLEIKKQASSLLTNTHKNMRKKDLLVAFEELFDVTITKNQSLI